MKWECNINKTQPIVLLEIFRKLFNKVLTKRLFYILAIYKILKDNNYAGLLGSSTLELINMLNMIMKNV